MAKEKRRDSFVYHLAWEDVLDNLPEEVREEVRGAIIGYARTGVTPELKPLAAVAFAFVRRDMDWDIRKYEDMVSARSESGRKGGSARQSEQGGQDRQSQANEAKQANASFAKQNRQSQANEAIYDYEYEYVPHNVCGDGAQARTEGVAASTPHTQADFFFMTFWERNVSAPHREAQRFVDFYGSAGWRLEKGGELDTDEKRLAKARSWKPETPGGRFPEGFIPAWRALSDSAPEDVRERMYDDRVAVKTDGSRVAALVCHESVKLWIMGDGAAKAREQLVDGWLDGNGGRTLRIITYKS